MTEINKKALSERDICTKYITPALAHAGWDVLTRIREEVAFTAGKIMVKGKTSNAASLSGPTISFISRGTLYRKGKPMPSELTWRKAIERVLSEAPGAMHYKELTEKIIDDGLRTSLGATPAATVYALLHTAIKNEGVQCPFQKIGKGLFVWKAKAGITQKPMIPNEEPEEEEVQYEIISSFGMFWRREAIAWTGTPKILGMQQLGAEPVDFQKQLGIYLLYDGREIIYVGRATERPLGRRLYEHTADRLSTRWDRFSWFGILPVSEAGELGDLPDNYLGPKLVPAIEAILIEALEPRQNRKRGDDLSAVEYIQKEDPEIQKKREKQIAEKLLGRLS